MKRLAEFRISAKKLPGRTRELLFKKPKLDLLFLALMALTFSYVGLAAAMHTLRPFAPIVSDSMEPFIFKGDLILIKNIPSSQIKEKYVIVFQAKIPGRDSIELAHRVVRIEKDPAAGLVFWTKGDNLEQMDGFGTLARDVRGVAAYRIPILGYILMYFQSLFTWIVIGLAALFYIVIDRWGGIIERFKGWNLARTDPELLKRLDRQDESMQIFTEAVRDYGIHLQSHTSLVRGMNDSAEKLGDSSEKLTDAVERLDAHVERLVEEKNKPGLLKWLWQKIM